jgi:hypothetical protein
LLQVADNAEAWAVFYRAVDMTRTAYATEDREHFQPWEQELGDGPGPE